MEKSEVRILIVEDDPTLGRSLLELFKRQGYDTVLTGNPLQALGMANHLEFHVLILDCMLPKMNGVDLAREMIKLLQPKPLIFLMTGVFKDRSFIKDALAKTGAVTMMSKPFQLDEMLEAVEVELRKDAVVEPEMAPIPRLLTLSECSSEQILECLQAQPSLPAYQLPLLLSLFARQGMTGYLNIVSNDHDISHITLIDGRIVDVKLQNPSTNLGELLIEFGFAMAEDVEHVLKDPRFKGPLGARLVQAALLSPHAIGIIREEQLSIRLSHLIQNGSMEVTWAPDDVKMLETFYTLPPSRLKNLMSEWILSKIPAEWLRSFYLQFSERAIGWRGKAAMRIEGAKIHMTMLPDLLRRISEQPTLQDLLLESGDNDLRCLQAIHTMILERKIFFGERRHTDSDFDAKFQRYERLNASFEQKDYYQILGVNHKAKTLEIQHAFTELSKQLHPDKIQKNAPENLKELANKIFATITNAYACLTDDEKRASYLEELSRQEASRIFALEPVFENAVEELNSKNYQAAMKKFEQLILKRAPMPDLRAYYYWAKIKSGQKLLEKDFFEIPPEHRHSGVYLFAKGLYYKSIGQLQKALECLQNARLMDRRLTETKAEIAELAAEARVRDGTITTFISKIMGGKQKRSA